MQPPEPFDGKAATHLAVKQGLGVVLAGSIEKAGEKLKLRLDATQAITGRVIAQADTTAAGREDVLAATGRLASEIREALGGDSSDSKQRFAMDTLTATSVDVVRDYALAMDSLSNSRFEEARASFDRAVARDPSFGLAHAGLAPIHARSTAVTRIEHCRK